MKPAIDFTIDRTRVTEGDTVEIKWSCPDAETVELLMDNGFRQMSLNLEKEGSKKFRINRSKGPTNLRLKASAAGKSRTKVIPVKVRRLKTEKGGNGYDSYTRLDKRGLKDRWNDFVRKARMAWASLDEKKQFAFTILGLLTLMMILTSFFPKLMTLWMLPLLLVLFRTILKK